LVSAVEEHRIMSGQWRKPLAEQRRQAGTRMMNACKMFLLTASPFVMSTDQKRLGFFFLNERSKRVMFGQHPVFLLF